MDRLATRRAFIGAVASAAVPLALPPAAFAAAAPPLTALPLPAPPLTAPPLPADAVQRAEFAFSAHVLLEPTRDVGRTPYGIRRRIPIIGGSFEGPHIRGRIVPGGADWQLQRADDYTVLEADYMIETDDGVQIHVRNRGLTNTRVAGAKVRYLRTVPEFEAPTGPHDWLNQSVFVGSLQGLSGGPPAVMVHVFRLA